jgi:tetratricopeptide (TPR) repeat protein
MRAAELAESELRVNPQDPEPLMCLADCYSMLGQRERSYRLLHKAISIAPRDIDIMFQAAIVYEQLADRKQALQWIGKAMREGYSKELIERSPSLTKLRADPEYKALQNR